MLGLLGQLINKLLAGRKELPKVKPRRDRWDKAFAEDDNTVLSWKVV